jgi:hypothetical protein
MNDRNLLRGLFLIVVSLGFGLGSLRYSIGQFSHAGPGLFPLMVSCLLLLIGVISVVRSRYVKPERMDLHFKNIAIILGSLAGFALTSQFINVTAGIVVMVFLSSFAASSYSVSRNIKIAIGLFLIALAFHKLLGLNLPLY